MKGYSKDPERIADIVVRYGGRISTARRGAIADNSARAVLELLEEWSPIHARRSDLRAIWGPPTEEDTVRMEYVFDNGFSGHRWCFTLRLGIVTGMSWEPLD
jgi:hypothetical protein